MPHSKPTRSCCSLAVDEPADLVDAVAAVPAEAGKIGARQDAQQHVGMVRDQEVLQPRGTEVLEGASHGRVPVRHLRRQLRPGQEFVGPLLRRALDVAVALFQQRGQLRALDKAYETSKVVNNGETAVRRLQHHLDKVLLWFVGPQHNDLACTGVVNSKAFKNEEVVFMESVLQQVNVRVQFQHDVVDARSKVVGNDLADHDNQHQWQQEVHVVCDLDEDHRQRDSHAAEPCQCPCRAHERVDIFLHVPAGLQQHLADGPAEAGARQDIGNEEAHGDCSAEGEDRRHEHKDKGYQEARDAHDRPGLHLLAEEGLDRGLLRLEQDVANVGIAALWADAPLQHGQLRLDGAAGAPPAGQRCSLRKLPATDQHGDPEADRQRKHDNAADLHEPGPPRVPGGVAQLEQSSPLGHHELHHFAEQCAGQAGGQPQNCEGPKLPQLKAGVLVREFDKARCCEPGEPALR
mmetsp:Transcript_112900/g.319387  ORF Transcript_112900/g.319387 Transcript_112900/m.319387 type:complete len:462 (+) Transcript_112900:552-1937(+)